MAAIIGAETDVPPKPLHVLGAPAQDFPPWVVSEKQMVAKCPQMPFEAKSETSGISRTPSAGLPKMPDCHEGLAYPAHVPSTTAELVWSVPPPPVAQPLGPPAPAAVLRYVELAHSALPLAAPKKL